MYVYKTRRIRMRNVHVHKGHYREREKRIMGTSNSNNPLFVDDFYFSALYDEEELYPISDEKYAQELQLQEALMSSAISSRLKNEPTEMEHYGHCTPTKSLKGKEKEAGESSQSGESFQSLCIICMDAKPSGEMFRNNKCTHSFCTDCIVKYVATKIQENITMVKCPDLNCKGVLEQQFCRSIVPQEVFDRWENSLCESLIPALQKFYCPFKDCSAMLVDDGREVVTASECPSCHRLFCAQCKVSWHAGIECREFQNPNKDERMREDILVMELAKNKKWRRCPNCRFYVEKDSGCMHIFCRCGYEFCYGCGSPWSPNHACERI